jgi:hypothetical protein
MPRAGNGTAEFDATSNARRSSAFARQAPEAGGDAASSDYTARAADWLDSNAACAGSRDTTWLRTDSGQSIWRLARPSFRANTRACAVRNTKPGTARNCSSRLARCHRRCVNDHSAIIEQHAFLHRNPIARAAACFHALDLASRRSSGF